MKRRFLCMIAFLLIGGTMSAQQYTPNAHSYDNNMPIVATVLLDGVAQTGGELGAFIGNEVRGTATVQALLDNTYWIQVYYHSDTESSETITFKYFDGTDEYDVTTTVAVNPEGVGTKAAPQELEIVTAVTQTSAMAVGWNWWSASVELDGNSLQSLENSLGSNGDQILSRADGYANRSEYMGYSYWSGPLNNSNIYNEQMYMIQTNTACNIQMTGSRVSASNHPITISNGWNWIGYTNSETMSMASALQDFTPEVGDQIKGRSSFATYSSYQGYYYWSGTVDMVPGQGYMYLSNSTTPKQLIYSNNTKSEYTNTIFDNTVFKSENEDYKYNMSITAVVELEGDELRSKDFEVAAFVGDQCRGSVKLSYVEPLNRYEAFLLVFGDVEEEVHFVLTDGTNVSWSDDYLTYVNDGVVGSPAAPLVLHFGAFGVSENNIHNLRVFPNPSNGVFNIEGKDLQRIEILDSYGQIILVKDVVDDFVIINLSDKAVGTYLLRGISNNGIITNKLIKK